MTPEQLREAAAVMLAAAEGKKVQCRYDDSGHWLDLETPHFNFAAVNYRIKPEPRKVRVQLLKSKENGQIYAFREREVPGYTQYGQWIPCSDFVDIEVSD